MKSAATLATAVLCVTMAATAHGNSASEKWQAGWDGFRDRLDYKSSRVTWSRPGGTKQLSVNYILRGAAPNWQYQVGVHVFDRCDKAFGHYRASVCNVITRQGVTRRVYTVELGVVTTDMHGNGSFRVNVTDIGAGTYAVEFSVRGDAGCMFGGAGTCDVVFQSPGPFGNTRTFTFGGK